MDTVFTALAVSAAVILAAWYLSGAFVTPVERMENISIQICVGVSGTAPGLEHTVSGLLWLIENGTMPGEIVICDHGMDETARLTAQAIARGEKLVHYRSLDFNGAGQGTD
jgi:hypothetical protein